MPERPSRSVYMDYASTTPVDGDLIRLLGELQLDAWGNPSSPHRVGQTARRLLDDAREFAAQTLGAKPGDIVFTSSATEANNLAIRGIVEAARISGGAYTKPHIIISAIEHASVLEPVRHLERAGIIEATYLPVDAQGLVGADGVREALRPNTILVSVMWVNNEIGTVEPVGDIAAAVQAYREKNKSRYPLFHADAAQAFLYESVNVKKDLVDLVTLSGHKINAPKGVGLLYIRDKAAITSIIEGGGQEYGLRSGTENAPLAFIMAKALERAVGIREDAATAMRALSGALERRIREAAPNARRVVSSDVASPHIVTFLFEGASGEELVYLFDEAGIAVSTGSACTTGKTESSHVLEAIGAPEKMRGSAIRFSLGKQTTENDVEYVAAKTADLLKKIHAGAT